MRSRPPTVAEIVGKHPQAFIGRGYWADSGDPLPERHRPPDPIIFQSYRCIGRVRVRVEKVLINRTPDPLFPGGTVTVAFYWPGPLDGTKAEDFLGRQNIWVTGYPPGRSPADAALQRHIGWCNVKHEAEVVNLIAKRNPTTAGAGIPCRPLLGEWNGLLVVLGAIASALAAGFVWMRMQSSGRRSLR